VDEIKRVLGVLEGCLTDRDWLVGDKMTFADLAFIPWNNWLEMIILCEEEKKFDGFPMVKAWHGCAGLDVEWHAERGGGYGGV
jgi:glutathione S-transferase